jgi:peptidylprolyl isomerase
VALCALSVLNACGDDAPEEKTLSGFDAVEISGPVGEVPEVDWKAGLKPGKTQSEIVDEGDGAVLEDGDKVFTNFAIANDVSDEVSFETYTSQGVLLEVGSETEPAQVVDLVTALIKDAIEPGTTTVGSRLAVTVDAEEEFGELALSLAQVGIGNEDGFVVVADLEAVPLDGPEGKERPAPSWAPEIIEKKGVPTSLDSSGLPKPDPKSEELRKALLVAGTGETVEKGDQIIANYIGQVYDADEPFDSGFARPDPSIFSIGTGGVVKGWDEGLVGVKVGSRVLLEIPPALGYGKKGNGEQIPGNSTLYFVVDILAAA